MTWFLRKSFRNGPPRLNLSMRGLGAWVAARLALVPLVLTLVAPSASVAAAGWYLLGPPFKAKPGNATELQWDLDAPLSRWEQIASFDTAARCEAGKAEDIENHRLAYKRFPPTDPAREGIALHWGRALNSRCIATDDPRLSDPKKP